MRKRSITVAKGVVVCEVRRWTVIGSVVVPGGKLEGGGIGGIDVRRLAVRPSWDYWVRSFLIHIHEVVSGIVR